MGVSDLPEERQGRFSKLKRAVKRGFRKVIPIAVSWAAGAVFPPAGAALYVFLKEKMDNNELPVKIADDDLRELCTGNDSIEKLQDKLKKVLSEKHGLNRSQLEMVLGTFLRPLNDAINDVMGYIQQYPDQLSYLMEEWRAENNQLLEQLSIDVEEGFNNIMDALINQSDKINLIIRKLSVFERILNKNFENCSKNIFSAESIEMNDLKLLSRAQLAGIYHSIRSPYDITFNPDLFVKRKSADIAFEDFLMDSTSAFTSRFLFLVLAGVGMGKTWTLASWAKRLSEGGFDLPDIERFIPFFIPLKLDFNTQIKGLTGTNSVMNAIEKLKHIRDVSNTIPILFLDGLDEISIITAKNVLNNIINLSNARIPVVLSCRDTDWSREEQLADIQLTLRDYCFKHDSGSSYNIRDVSCPPSVYLELFTDSEFSAALERYEIPENAFYSEQLKEMAHYPVLLRLFSEYYRANGFLPDPSDPKAFSPIFLGTKDAPPETNILGRLGIIGTKRDYLLRLLRKFFKKGPDSELRTDDINDLIAEGENFRIVRSSGLIDIKWTPLGAAFKLNSLYLPHLRYMAELAGIKIKGKEKETPKKPEKDIEKTSGLPPKKDDELSEKRKRYHFLINMGNELLSSGDYDGALENFSKARDISEELADIELGKRALERIKYTKSLIEKEREKEVLTAKLRKLLGKRKHSTASKLAEEMGIDTSTAESYLRAFAHYDAESGEFWINRMEFDRFKALYALVNFRGTKIHKFEADALGELESLTGKEFNPVNEIEWNTKMGFTVSNNFVTGIGLYKCGLTTLPESFWNLKSLQILGLGGNKFTTLPESIGKLSSLEELYLGGNQLTTLPESIGNLKSLEYLSLYNNKLTTLPESFWNLKSLQILSLGSNKFTTLPESFWNFTTLPESLLNLISLKTLYFNKPDEERLDTKGKRVLSELRNKGVEIKRW
ncbi:MAG: leucine-rich repeat domain-containing protein [Promethearchaeota archaeon]